MPAGGSKRVALVTDEILGLTRNAGAATANTFLSFALADRGHDVEILYPAPIGPEGVAATWRREYDRRSIRIRGVPAFPHEVSPRTATVTYAVREALRIAPPDVVIADDRYGSCYASVRMRRSGLEFPNTLFAIYCHGTSAWIAEAHRKVRRWPASFEIEALERAAVELADVVVSPSAYMLDWMRGRGWELPRALVAPLLTRSAIDPAPPDEPVAPTAIRRVSFFGRLEERKGLQPFVDALNGIDPDRLGGVELLFIGKPTPAWSVERVRAMLSQSVTAALVSVRFEAELDQPDAVALLKRPGTLAVMPSLLDNSPMVIYECLEHGIPFLASSFGGGPELVAEEDRRRCFVEPTAPVLQRRLAEILSGREEYAPARAAFDTEDVLGAWEAAISPSPHRHEATPSRGSVTAIVRRRGDEDVEGCLRALHKQMRPADQVVVVQAQSDAPPATGDFLFVVAAADEPEPDCLETLLRAQSATGADVVTCAVRDEQISFFLGDARELGLIRNHYGLAGLYRRAAVDGLLTADTPEWLTLASLALAGRQLVSLPRPLVHTSRTAETAATAPDVALRVVEAFERAGPHELQGLPTVAAALAARASATSAAPSLRQRATRAARAAFSRGTRSEAPARAGAP